MPRIVLSLEEWRAVARELAATHTIAAPPGLSERVRELLAQAHDGWTEQAIALELDEGSAAHNAASQEDRRNSAMTERDTNAPAPKLPEPEPTRAQKAPKPPKPRKVERRRKGRKG